LYAGVPVRFPNVKITLSESGISWLPLLLDRLEYVETRLFHEGNDGGLGMSWAGMDISPTEAVRRNFWFTSFFDPTAYRVIDRIGADRVMLEVDFPHPDTTWPDTQSLVERQIGWLDDEVIDKISHRNALDLYRIEPPKDLDLLEQASHHRVAAAQ
jgi:predicted TIM-barrel fold metal-dependent hydrolase